MQHAWISHNNPDTVPDKVQDSKVEISTMLIILSLSPLLLYGRKEQLGPWEEHGSMGNVV